MNPVSTNLPILLNAIVTDVWLNFLMFLILKTGTEKHLKDFLYRPAFYHCDQWTTEEGKPSEKDRGYGHLDALLQAGDKAERSQQEHTVQQHNTHATHATSRWPGSTQTERERVYTQSYNPGDLPSPTRPTSLPSSSLGDPMKLWL